MFDSRTTSSSSTKFVNNHDHILHPFRLKNDDADDDDDDDVNNYDAKNAQDPERNWHGETTTVQFRTQHMDAESGSSSPPLWKTSPTRRRTSRLNHHQHPRRTYSDDRVPSQMKFSGSATGRDNHRRSLSPTSRVQAIARGQREMMEMAKNMPETYYELSLKDLVEYGEETQEECLIQDKNNNDDEQEIVANQAVNVKRQVSGNKPKMARNGSIDNRGLFLKMVFPVTFRSKKKKSSATGATGAKVSPKPEGSEKSSRSVDREWWKRRLSTSSESESVVTSSNSGSSGSSGSSNSRRSRTRNDRKRNSMLNSCCSCFQSRKDK